MVKSPVCQLCGRSAQKILDVFDDSFGVLRNAVQGSALAFGQPRKTDEVSPGVLLIPLRCCGCPNPSNPPAFSQLQSASKPVRQITLEIPASRRSSLSIRSEPDRSGKAGSPGSGSGGGASTPSRWMNASMASLKADDFSSANIMDSIKSGLSFRLYPSMSTSRPRSVTPSRASD